MDAPSAREMRRRQGSCGIPRHKQPWHVQHDEVALAIQHALCRTPRACKQQPELGCSCPTYACYTVRRVHLWRPARSILLEVHVCLRVFPGKPGITHFLWVHDFPAPYNVLLPPTYDPRGADPW
jgi:hypothetical protein